ncbi:ABC transporter [Corynebacterium yudongzhengii]|uniref:ABC transporter ATP-binding protein n=2 Tax=Corynebacterium yudongzhengii TaxID=2080740 RepID=A0A2U1T6C5_9CORY|nr:ABC transporter [Corynebacterium yudongzhengii]PWC01557.1 ABC transporter ATP-binding protein [Corynebacterium yudongzhengii]
MLAHHRGVFAVVLVLSLISSVLALAQPLIVNRMIDGVGEIDLLGPALILIAFLLATAVSEGVQIYLLSRTAESAVRNLRVELIARMLRLPIRIYDRLRTGDLVTRLGSDTTLVRSAFSGGLVDIVAGVVTMLGALVLMGFLDIVMLSIVASVILVAVTVVMFVSQYVQKYTNEVQQAVGRLGAGMDRALVAQRTIRANNAAGQVEKELIDDADTAFAKGRQIAMIEGLLWPVTDIAMQASFLLVLGIGGLRVAAGDISLGDLVSFVLYMFLLAMPLGQIFSSITTIRQAMGALQRVGQVLDQDTEDTEGPEIPRGSSITFDSVSFGYDPKQPVLRDASFHVPAGARVALVGPSGSGKSTTLALLERFFDPDAGRILIDGSDIRKHSRTSVRDLVGYVEQEATVLAGSVRDNLRLARSDATDEECWAALRQVNLDSRLQSLDDELGDRGISLSGGQRQRLALARMLLMRAPILLLDEPTSAVDSHNEQLILDAIKASAKDRTVIIVAHRLSTVTDADEIVVMRDGVVEDRGTHDELLRTSPLYHDLASRQLLA